MIGVKRSFLEKWKVHLPNTTTSLNKRCRNTFMISNDLREKGCCERDNPEVSQNSFLKSENSDAELGFKFE